MYEQRKWALLPETHIIERFLTPNKVRTLCREEFANVNVCVGSPSSNTNCGHLVNVHRDFKKEPTYNYTFLPLTKDLEQIGIHRQTCDSPPAFTTHTYPFDTLPTLKSHIHPKFAITHLGAALRDLAHSSLERYLKLKEQHPILYTIRMLCWRWSILPDRAVEDPTYVVPQASSALDEDGEEDDLPNSESGDSVETVPRRVEYVFEEDEKRELRRREERSAARRAAQLRKRRLSIDDTYPDECPARGEGPVRTVEGGVLKHSKVDADGWTPDTISAWAQRCTGGPEDHSIPTSPPILRPRLENMESSGAPATS
ncbi:hypothetical protein CC1G_09253 [Coprinopsis cinerea okayama7|uniref:Uncharacterized protein n=1 Tax=Coprinopsis cinerea (strain Okayama-7 / 130 / ATCC MYA-4618 / FGSC 9003) TaxID=240176 RepID=A8P550_COPC7|nr:hypothetical protein CC1G_09253 [Coprinopsis cinerea okayama7\|eukprot:XP_001838876.2 hypothetical protein CC1G_09253 [Coprinopsis cinerea okayama7\